MKRIVTIVLMLIVFAGSAGAADYIRIDIDTVVAGATGVDFDFYFTRECPDPPSTILGIENGFWMTANGCSWTFNGCTNHNTDWFSLGGLLFTDGLTPNNPNATTGGFLVGGAAMAPNGMPIVIEELSFSLNFDISNDEGEICIDSTSPWSWSGLTCGQGGAPDRPLFVDKSGSDDNHPICIAVVPCQSGPSQLMTSPFDDQLTGPTCVELSFDFDADCEDECSFSVLDGPGSIGQTDGIYNAPILPEGTYQVTIQIVEPICRLATEYNFDLTYIAEVAGDMDCSGLTDIDDVVYTIEYIFSSGSAPHSDPDCSGDVDIDDVVFLINYIFSGGSAPCIPGEPAVITGTIEWSEHQLTRPVVFLDIEPGSGIVPYLGLGFLADPVTGQFTMSYDLDDPITACVVAWDDLNQNSMLEPGEPVGWWDIDENGMWNDDDMIMFVSGSSIIDIYIELLGAGKNVIYPNKPLHIVNSLK